jgi:hypothetical protein
MPRCVACANLPGQLWFHPFFTKRRTRRNNPVARVHRPMHLLPMTSVLQHCPAIPMTGTRSARSFRMQALIGNVLDRCITDAGYRRHNACPITSSRSTPPGQKSRVTPQIKRESKRRTPSSPPPQGNATAWAAITLPMPFSPPPATTFAAYPRGLTFSGRARRRCHSLVSLSDAAVSREI